MSSLNCLKIYFFNLIYPSSNWCQKWPTCRYQLCFIFRIQTFKRQTWHISLAKGLRSDPLRCREGERISNPWLAKMRTWMQNPMYDSNYIRRLINFNYVLSPFNSPELTKMPTLSVGVVVVIVVNISQFHLLLQKHSTRWCRSNQCLRGGFLFWIITYIQIRYS